MISVADELVQHRYTIQKWRRVGGQWLPRVAMEQTIQTNKTSPAQPAFRHVLCVHPYRRGGSSLTAFPPIGLEYVAAALRPFTEKIELVNYRQTPRADIRRYLRPETDLVCYSINWRKELDSIRREINSLPPEIMVILGGRAATEDPQFWLDACPNVAAVVCGDGERAIVEIAQGLPWSEIAGLCRRGDQGEVLHNQPRDNAPLDEDLLPARDLRQKPHYMTTKGISTGVKVDMVAGSRGCPYDCKFCNFAVNPWGVKRRWAPRSPQSIVREIKQIEADVIFFVDDVFTHQPDRVAEICDLLIAEKIHKNYIVNARLEIAKRPDVLRKMEQAGFIALMVGVESTQDATLASMNRGYDIEQVREWFDVLRKSKMLVNAYFIVGNIGETEEQMLSIAPFARSIGASLIYVSRLRNEPHSKLAELVEQSPGYHVDPRGYVYSDQYSADYIAKLRKQIDRRFFSPLHVAAIIGKLLRILSWRAKIKVIMRAPGFLGRLVASQTVRKLRKWLKPR